MSFGTKGFARMRMRVRVPTADAGEAAMNGSTRQVVLREKIPVYIVYFTAYVRDGTLWFANDLYERDSKLVKVVERSAIPSPREVALLAEIRKLAD
jgi:murein L,D-transpeptidase YcbB/YkuD